jgi:hypothetical protein
MSGAARLAAGAFLVLLSLAAWSATPKKAAPSAAPAPATAPSAAAPPASAPTEFAGTFVAGTTYVSEMAFDSRALKTWRPLKDVQPGKNVAWTIVWTNLEQFPALKTPATQARPQRFRFRVTKTETLSGSPALPWMATYRCEILAFEPVAVTAPANATTRRR